ncbi:hypothetical protein A9259_07320 [Vibrio cyclitrophicus]|nr:hypothetical protein A9259_07320 [Vibrio cyclitrophicus]
MRYLGLTGRQSSTANRVLALSKSGGVTTTTEEIIDTDQVRGSTTKETVALTYPLNLGVASGHPNFLFFVRMTW